LQPRDIVVIGGSAGSIEALQTIMASLPPGFPASIFIVVHVPADYPNLLAKVLSRSSYLPATNPGDLEQIQHAHIYVARPDHHLTIEDGRVRVQRGPRENRHRPAIDPLFRTAAREYGPRVIGIVLSGLQDDGSAGLYAVKQRNGIAIVQEPRDSISSEMPRRALTYASPHYILRTRDIAPSLIELVNASKSAMGKKNFKSKKPNGKNHKNRIAVSAALERPAVNLSAAYSEEGTGTPSVFACPECHGVLWELRDNKMVHFRCRVGHSFGPESLATELSMASEAALWAALRALEEKAAMQRRMAKGMGQDSMTSRRLLDQSAADAANARLIRDMIFRCDAELEPERPGPQLEERPSKRKAA
jgi:two-component system, chemotaxis family, protein-glutamate methylesterase/glutaminase